MLVIVGIALLAFIIGDFLNSGATYFNQSRENVAEIAGQSIHILEYQKAIDEMVDVYKLQSGMNDLTEDQMAQIRTSVWETMVSNRLLEVECEKIGLTVTSQELGERIFGSNPHPLLSQCRAFMDENGRFSHNALMQFYSYVNQDGAEQSEELMRLRNYYLFWENAVRSSLLQEKYVAILSKAVTANVLEAKNSFDSRKTTVDASYVMQPYYAIPDSVVSVSDSEIKSLYSKRKEQYKQEPNRTIHYVCFDIVPSEADYEEVRLWMEKLKPEFDTTDDVAGLVNSNSDIMYDGSNYSQSTVPAEYKEFAFSGSKGDVTPIEFSDDTYRTARIMEAGLMLPDSVKLRHIYLADNNEERMDSIVEAIRGGADFAALASKYSAVPQTAANGGEIGWVGEYGLAPEIAEPAFSKATNEVFTVKQGLEAQIFQIMERSEPTPKVKLAILSRKVTPSSRTYSALYNSAKRFIVEHGTMEAFESGAKEQELTVMPAFGLQKNTEKVGSLAQSRQIVRWAFDDKTKRGAVSDVFECNDCFVIALLTEVNDGEYRSLQNVSGELKAELIKDKKAEKIMQEMKAVLAKDNTLEAVAKAVKAEVQQAEGINFSSYRFGTAGVEPGLIGLAPYMEVGQLSEPVKGNNGVYVIQTSNPKESDATYNEASELMQLNMYTSYSLPYRAIELIRQKASIEDNRANFY